MPLYLAANRTRPCSPTLPVSVRAARPAGGFGGTGPHFCIGAHMARREITVMFRELFRRPRIGMPVTGMNQGSYPRVKHCPFYRFTRHEEKVLGIGGFSSGAIPTV